MSKSGHVYMCVFADHAAFSGHADRSPDVITSDHTAPDVGISKSMNGASGARFELILEYNEP